MVNLQTPTMRHYCRPHLVVGQAFAGPPAFPQDPDRPLRTDLADKVEPSGRDRQRRWDCPELACSQPLRLATTARLRGGQPRQCGGAVPGHVPLDELAAFASPPRHRAEGRTLPKASDPQALEAFHQPIAFRLAGRGEDRFTPPIQTQADKLAKATRRLL